MSLHATIIAKAPVPGRVKTRLCPPCTYDQAAAIAAAGLADTIEAIDAIPGITGTGGDVAVRRTLLLDGALPSWTPRDYAVISQRGDGLGERLRNGFSDLGPGVVTGMETPHVASLLGPALEQVRSGADVIGLAEDGGYWMLGLCASTIAKIDDVFDGIPMSSSSTGALQLQRLCDLGADVVLLPVARDLDTIDDLIAVARSGRDGRLATLARSTIAELRGAVPAARRSPTRARSTHV